PALGSQTTADLLLCFFFSSRRRHTRFSRDWSSDVCSSDLSRNYLDRNLRELREAQVADETETAPEYPRWQFWRRIAAWWRLDASTNDAPAGPTSIGDLIVERDRMRQQYLDRAAELDKTIVEYHDTLPRELSHLQRLRMLPERAARLFDEHVPIGMLVGEEASLG